jgi:hypothetical protein
VQVPAPSDGRQKADPVHQHNWLLEGDDVGLWKRLQRGNALQGRGGKTGHRRQSGGKKRARLRADGGSAPTTGVKGIDRIRQKVQQSGESASSGQ